MPRLTEDNGAPKPDLELAATEIVALLLAAPTEILVLDEAGRIRIAGQEAELRFDCDRRGLLGRPISDLLPESPQEMHGVPRVAPRAEPQSTGAGVLLFGRRADGSEFPIEISLSSRRAGAGLPAVAVVRDVTEPRVVEGEQVELRELLDVTRDAVLVVDADTLQFTYVNKSAAEQVGYSRDELLDMTMLQIAPELSEPQLRQMLAPLARGDAPSITFNTVHRHRDGTDIPVEILMESAPGDGTRPNCYFKIARDARDRTELEARLMELKQDLRVVEERERIARDLHDTVIQELFATSMTIHSVANQTIDAAHVSRLETAVENLDETISEIRSVVFGLHRDSPASVGIRARIVRIADDEHAALGFEPRIRFDGPVDALNERIAMELIAAAREALTNVARHAQASKVEIAVECNDHVTLRVVDDGRGVTTSAARGNGIRNLTDRAATLGGTCHLSSRPDGGTEFVWRVPACV